MVNLRRESQGHIHSCIIKKEHKTCTGNIKGVFRSRQLKKDKSANNDLQSKTQNTKDLAKRTLQETGVPRKGKQVLLH